MKKMKPEFPFFMFRLKTEIFFSYWDKERKCYFFREKMAHQNL